MIIAKLWIFVMVKQTMMKMMNFTKKIMISIMKIMIIFNKIIKFKDNKKKIVINNKIKINKYNKINKVKIATIPLTLKV